MAISTRTKSCLAESLGDQGAANEVITILNNSQATTDGANATYSGEVSAADYVGDGGNLTGMTADQVGATGRRFSKFTSTGNTDTTKVKLATTINTSTIDLTANGRAHRAFFFGTFGNNSHTKQLQVYFGNNEDSTDDLVLDSTALTASGSGTWTIEVIVIRDTSTTWRVFAELRINAGGMTATPIQKYTTGSFGTGALNQNEFSVYGTVGTGASANDVVCTMAYGEFLSGIAGT